MSDQHLDYHVGLLRGFVLAHNAPTAILHALDVLLTDYRSKAGDVIGAPKRTEIILPDMGTPKAPPAIAKAPPAPPEKPAEPPPRNFFWTAEQDKILEEMYMRGAKTREIAEKIDRTYASVQTRIATRGLKRPVRLIAEAENA